MLVMRWRIASIEKKMRSRRTNNLLPCMHSSATMFCLDLIVLLASFLLHMCFLQARTLNNTTIRLLHQAAMLTKFPLGHNCCAAATSSPISEPYENTLFFSLAVLLPCSKFVLKLVINTPLFQLRSSMDLHTSSLS